MESPSELSCEVSGGLHAALRASWASLVVPVRFDRSTESWRMSYSPRMAAFNVAFAAILAASTLTILVVVDYHLAENGFLVNSYDHILSLLLYITLTGTMSLIRITAGKRTKTLIQCVRNTDKVKASLNLDSKRNPKLTAAVITCIIVGLTSAVDFVESAILKHNFNGIILLHGLCFLQSYLFYLTVLLFSSIVVDINSILQEINDRLTKLLLVREGNDKVTSETSAETVRLASTAHGTMCDVIEDYNRSFGAILLAMLAHCVIYITLMSYVFVGVVPSCVKSTGNKMKVTYWLIHYFVSIFAIVEPCHSTHCKLMCTRRLVTKLAIKHKDWPASEELHKFCARLRLDQTSFNAMEVCSVDRPLLITMVATISTYLVILTQYRELDDEV